MPILIFLREKCGVISVLLAKFKWKTKKLFILKNFASCLSFSAFLCVAGRAYWWEREGRGWAGSQIIRSRGSLALWPSINHSIPSEKHKQATLEIGEFNDDIPHTRCLWGIISWLCLESLYANFSLFCKWWWALSHIHSTFWKQK